jgi:hypothetical protein
MASLSDDDSNDNDNAEEKEDDEDDEEMEEEQEGQEDEEEDYTEDQIIELHRVSFNTYYENKFTDKTKFIPDEVYDYIIECCQGWNQPDNPAAQKEYRRLHYKSNRYSKIFVLDIYTSPDGEEVIQIKRKDSKVGGTIVCKQSRVFDAIRDAHISTAHLAAVNTLAQVQLKYWNITKLEVQHFVKVCPVCAFKRHKGKKPKGAKKPIMSDMFRDRFQVDLIDYTNMKCTNHYGIVMKWLMVCKDHFTGFTVLAAIPSKHASHVIHELSYIFGMIGYPTFFHTDNGKEFVAKEVIKGLKDIAPSITSVTGRPRCPSDQGSVEKQNALAKKMILNLEQMGKGPWADNLGPIMSAMNTKPFGTGPSKISAYETVFGMPYGNTEQVPHAELRKCVTVKDRLQLVSSPRLKLLAQQWYDLDYDSDDDENEVEEVEEKPDPPSSDAEDDGDTKPAAKPTPVKKKTATVKQNPSRANPSRKAKSPPQAKAQVMVQPKRNPPRSDAAKQLWSQKNNPYAKKSANKLSLDIESDTEVQVVESKPEFVSNELSTISMTQAWKKGGEPRTLLSKKVFRMIYPYLICQECLHYGEMPIIVGEAKYLEYLTNTTNYFEHDFIRSHATMAAHLKHDPSIRVLHILFPKASLTKNQCLKLKPEVKQVISILQAADHFCLLVLDVKTLTIEIYDGMDQPLSYWTDHAVQLLQRCKLVPLVPLTFRSKKNPDPYTLRRFECISGKDCWRLQKGPTFMIQRDGYNCGPIASLKVMELFGRLPKTLTHESLRSMSSKELREIVCQDFSAMTYECSGQLLVRVSQGHVKVAHVPRKGLKLSVCIVCLEYVTDHNPGIELSCCNRKDIHLNCYQSFMDNSASCPCCSRNVSSIEANGNFIDKMTSPVKRVDANLLLAMSNDSDKFCKPTRSPPKKRSPIEEVRATAVMKRKKIQDDQAEKMKRTRMSDLSKTGGKIGDIVSLKIDPRDVSNSHALIGIVFQVSTSECGGCRIATVEGIISNVGRVLYVPAEQYKVQDGRLVIDANLAKLRAAVMAGKLNEDKMPKISMRMAHELKYSRSSVGKRKCSCKGKCGKSCGCVKNKAPCSSGCKCYTTCCNRNK